jgi:hypothetical protein
MLHNRTLLLLEQHTVTAEEHPQAAVACFHSSADVGSVLATSADLRMVEWPTLGLSSSGLSQSVRQLHTQGLVLLSLFSKQTCVYGLYLHASAPGGLGFRV